MSRFELIFAFHVVVVVQSFLLAAVTSQKFIHSQVFQNRLLTSSFTASNHRCSVQSVDWLECITRCTKDNNCVSYHFDILQETCGLNSFGLANDCDGRRLVYSEGVLFQQLREEKNQVQCLSEMTCAPQQNQAGGESCSRPKTPRTSCNDIKVRGESRGDGEYIIKPPGSSELLVYCDMTTDGGGWTLVKKTVVSSKTPSTLSTLTSNWRSISQYNDPKLIVQPSALKELKSLIEFQQMRWFCYKKFINRKVHIMTKIGVLGENVIRYFTESPQTAAKACDSFTCLPDDNSLLGQSCSGWGTDNAFSSNLNEWGRRDYNGETRVQRDVMVWLKSLSDEHYFSMYPGRYLCDDNSLGSISINDTWAYYVR